MTRIKEFIRNHIPKIVVIVYDDDDDETSINVEVFIAESGDYFCDNSNIFLDGTSAENVCIRVSESSNLIMVSIEEDSAIILYQV